MSDYRGQLLDVLNFRLKFLQKYILLFNLFIHFSFHALNFLSHLSQPNLTLLVGSLLTDLANIIYLRFKLDCCNIHLAYLLFGLNYFSLERANKHQHGLLLLFFVLHKFMFCSLPFRQIDRLVVQFFTYINTLTLHAALEGMNT